MTDVAGDTSKEPRELLQVPVGLDARLLEMAELGLARDLRSATGLERELDASYRVPRTATTGHGPAAITVTGVCRPSSVKSCVMPSFRPMMALEGIGSRA